MGSGLSPGTQIILVKPGPRDPSIPCLSAPQQLPNPAPPLWTAQRQSSAWRWQKGARPFLTPHPPPTQL